MNVRFRAMTIADYPAVLKLWKRAGELNPDVKGSESKAAVAAFLKRNPKLSLVGVAGTKMVAAALVGHDGRRGYLHRVAVDAAHRGEGLGRTLMDHAMINLRSVEVYRATMLICVDNAAARGFCTHCGWSHRTDLVVMQQDLR